MKITWRCSNQGVWRWGKVVVLILIICFITTIILARWLLSPLPQIPPAQLTINEVIVQAKIGSKILKELRRRHPRRQATLKLKEREVQSLLVASDHITMLIPELTLPIPLRYYQLGYQNGIFKATIPIDSGCNLFGGYIMMYVEFSLQKNDSNFNYAINKFSISGLNLPPAIAKYFFDNWLEEQKKSLEYQYFDSVIKSISFDSSPRRLVIVYRPDKINL